MSAPESPSTDRAAADRVDSNWWYVVAVMPVLSLLGFLVFGWVVAALFFSLGFGLPMGGMMGPMAVAGPLVVVFLPLFLLGMVGTVLTALFPIALYLDAEAVAAADVGWDPDPALYALVAVVGIVATAFLLDVAVSLYYLYQRHQHVGTP
ncbi:hypothetical protein [Halostella litorea]|uniref:hypothetical protein n=1 Tax=Halostella litorea TaxID=2528831 RepID=UPI001091F3B8|nr:hypothetical protein [Halostella litorea]